MNANRLPALLTVLIISLIFYLPASAMPLKMSKEDLVRYTSQWEGERFPDGRPKVPDDLIERMKSVNIEEAWSVLRNEGYDYQFERLKTGTYTPGQIDGRWSDEIEKDFSQWLRDHIDELSVPKEQIQELLKERTW